MDPAKALRSAPDGVLLEVKVVPGARRDRIVGMLGDRIKASVSAPPEGGRANARVCELLAGTLGVRVSEVEVRAGSTGPRKTVHVRGVTPGRAAERLRAAMEGSG